MKYKDFMLLREKNEGNGESKSVEVKDYNPEELKKASKELKEIKKEKSIKKIKELARKVFSFLPKLKRDAFKDELERKANLKIIEEAIKSKNLSFKEWLLLKEEPEEEKVDIDAAIDIIAATLEPFNNKEGELKNIADLRKLNSFCKLLEDKKLANLNAESFNKFLEELVFALNKKEGDSVSREEYESYRAAYEKTPNKDEYFALLTVIYQTVGNNENVNAFLNKDFTLKRQRLIDARLTDSSGSPIDKFFDVEEDDEGNITYIPNKKTQKINSYLNAYRKNKVDVAVESMLTPEQLKKSNNYETLLNSIKLKTEEQIKDVYEAPLSNGEANKDEQKNDRLNRPTSAASYADNGNKVNRVVDAETKQIEKETERTFSNSSNSDGGYKTQKPRLLTVETVGEYIENIEDEFRQHINDICAKYAKTRQLRSEAASKKNAEKRTLDDNGLSESISSAFRRAEKYNNTINEGIIDNLIKTHKENKRSKKDEKEYKERVNGKWLSGGAQKEYDKAKEAFIANISNKSFKDRIKDFFVDPGMNDNELGSTNEDGTFQKTKGFERAEKLRDAIFGGTGKKNNLSRFISATRELANAKIARATGGRITLQQRAMLEGEVSGLLSAFVSILKRAETIASRELKEARGLFERKSDGDSNIRAHDRMNRVSTAKYDANVIIKFLNASDNFSADPLYDMKKIGKMMIASILASQSKQKDGETERVVTPEHIKRALNSSFKQFTSDPAMRGENLFLGEKGEIYFYSLEDKKLGIKHADFSNIKVTRFSTVKEFLNAAFGGGDDFDEVMKSLENTECYDYVRTEHNSELKVWVGEIKKYNSKRKEINNILNNVGKNPEGQKPTALITNIHKTDFLFESKFSKYGERIILEENEKVRQSADNFHADRKADVYNKLGNVYNDLEIGKQHGNDEMLDLEKKRKEEERYSETRDREKAEANIGKTHQNAMEVYNRIENSVMTWLDNNCCYLSELDVKFGEGERFGFNGSGIEDVAMRQNFVGKNIITFELNGKMILLKPQMNNSFADFKKNVKKLKEISNSDLSPKEQYKNVYRTLRNKESAPTQTQPEQSQQQPNATVTTVSADSTYGDGYNYQKNKNPLNRMKEIVYKNGKYTVKTRQII